MEMDYTLYNMVTVKGIKTFDIVANPGFGAATITTANFVPRNYIRKKKIKNLFNF